jgi:hypothetical protein
MLRLAGRFLTSFVRRHGEVLRRAQR